MSPKTPPDEVKDDPIPFLTIVYFAIKLNGPQLKSKVLKIYLIYIFLFVHFKPSYMDKRRKKSTSRYFLVRVPKVLNAPGIDQKKF